MAGVGRSWRTAVQSHTREVRHEMDRSALAEVEARLTRQMQTIAQAVADLMRRLDASEHEAKTLKSDIDRLASGLLEAITRDAA